MTTDSPSLPMTFAAVGMAIQRIGDDIPLRRARRPICETRRRSFTFRAAALPWKGSVGGETTVIPSGVVRVSFAYDFNLRPIFGRRSRFFSDGRPIEIELTKITLLPARANCFIRCVFECGW